MEQQHTPTPWVYRPEDAIHSDSAFVVWTGKGPGYGAVCYTAPYGVGNAEDAANAAFIVRACNAHAALLAAANLAVERCPCSIAERISGHRLECYAPELAAAIALAEGRE